MKGGRLWGKLATEAEMGIETRSDGDESVEMELGGGGGGVLKKHFKNSFVRGAFLPLNVTVNILIIYIRKGRERGPLPSNSLLGLRG